MIEFQFKLNEVYGELVVTSQRAYQEISRHYSVGDIGSIVDSLLSMAIWNDKNRKVRKSDISESYSPTEYAAVNGITDIYISINDSPPKKLI